MDSHDEVPPVPFLEDPLESGGAPASTDALRKVLTRHRTRQFRIIGASLAAVLAAGGVAGFLIGQSNSSTPSTRITSSAADQPAAAAAAPATETATAQGSVATAGPVAAKWTQLVLRNATDGTRVRLYSQDISPPTVTCAPSGPCPAQAKAACMPTQSLVAEVSDDQVAGEAGGPVWQAPTGTFDGVTAEVVGGGQPQPILVVIGHAASDVAKVVLTTSYGTDTLAPTTAGWAALAQQLPSTFESSTAAPADVPPYKPWPGLPDGTITALSSTGATLATVKLSEMNNGATKMPCGGGPGCMAPSAGASPASKPAATNQTSAAVVPPPSPVPPCPACPPPPVPAQKQANGATPATATAGNTVVMCAYSSGSGGSTAGGSSGSSSGGSSGSSSGGGSSGSSSSGTATAVPPAAP